MTDGSLSHEGPRTRIPGVLQSALMVPATDFVWPHVLNL
ncbi:hypothetical protein FM113_17795 [Leucobacter sp. 7(1)]|nr:hypothetical protein FM113_17795 [Leucobacter sp. 7(1)]